MTKRKKILAVTLMCAMLLFAAFALSGLQRGQLSFLHRFLTWTHMEWTKPLVFGAFHLCWLVLCVAAACCFGAWGARSKAGVVDLTVFAAGLLLLALELYKQFYSYFILHGGRYDFGILPFQFCSLPLYLFLTVPFLRDGRLKTALYAFLALYGTMGGCLVMAYPRFYTDVILCFHTMLWHTVMIVIGVFLLFSKGFGKRYVREMLGATAVFLCSVLIATGLNILLAPVASTSPNPLNLFYMSPYHNTYFWVVRDVQEMWGWGASLLVYILLFVLVGATLVFWLTFVIRKLANFLAEKNFWKKT